MQAYLAALAAANDADCAAGGGARPAQDDWADLDALRFLDTAALKDPDGRPVVLVLSKQYPAGAASLERLYRCGAVRWLGAGSSHTGGPALRSPFPRRQRPDPQARSFPCSPGRP